MAAHHCNLIWKIYSSATRTSLKRLKSGGTRLPGSFAFLITVTIVAIVAFYAFTVRVDPDELGVVLLFGKPIRTEPPGLHFRLPYPIEEVRLPKVTRQNIIEIGMRSSEVTRGVSTVPEESLMLTGTARRILIDTNRWQKGANIDRCASRLSIERGQAMPFSTRYVFVVSMDVDPAKEALFNEVYDTEHVPFLKQVPGVRAVTRMQGEPFTHQVGGEAIAKKHEAARYTAIYEIDNPDVLMSPEWRVQGEKGRWAKEVRPFTKNRSHTVYKVR